MKRGHAGRVAGSLLLRMKEGRKEGNKDMADSRRDVRYAVSGDERLGLCRGRDKASRLACRECDRVGVLCFVGPYRTVADGWMDGRFGRGEKSAYTLLADMFRWIYLFLFFFFLSFLL